MTDARSAFLRAAWLDVAVRKPGNVSVASAGHRMQADLFVRSAAASAAPLCMEGARVGARIEAAMRASWAAAGCNTNLGILLLCAPLARAAEALDGDRSVEALRASVGGVLDELDLDDARAAYRAIALANPGGLGSAPEEDVHAAPTIDLRGAMALAADRDFIARQYRDGYADLFDASQALGCGFSLDDVAVGDVPQASIIDAVHRVFLHLLARHPDSHIVRKHGEAVAQNVMAAAQPWQARASHGERLEGDPAFAAWDETLKAAGINPGTSADLTVAVLFAAGLTEADAPSR